LRFTQTEAAFRCTDSDIAAADKPECTTKCRAMHHGNGWFAKGIQFMQEHRQLLCILKVFTLGFGGHRLHPTKIRSRRKVFPLRC
ncbi:hypothetical protein D039_2619B, partial [Vibrio parahaemolyticus EKP-028]